MTGSTRTQPRLLRRGCVVLPVSAGPASAVRLGEADRVAERVPHAAVDAVRALGRLLGEFAAPAEQRLVGLAAVVGAEDQAAAGRALAHQVTDLLGGLLGQCRRPRLLQQDV